MSSVSTDVRSSTADAWCMLVIAELRPIFKEKNWPLPDRIRAKQIYHHNSKWTHVIPAVDQDDGYAIVRYPSSHSHAERVIPAILSGLYTLALHERSRTTQVGAFDFGRGRTAFLRDHIGLTDENDEPTRFGVAIMRKIVAKVGAFPEGSSHPKPSKKYRRTRFHCRCSVCGEAWFTQNRQEYEISMAMGSFKCLLADCGGVITMDDSADDEMDNVIRMGRV